MTETETRDWILDGLRKGQPRRFVKYGDGEYLCMSGRGGGTCDGQPFTNELSALLRSAFSEYVHDDCTRVACWGTNAVHGDLQSRIVSELGEPRWASYETLLCQDDGTLPGLADFWQDFKSLGRSLVLVAPEPFAPIARWLGARHVLVHPTAAFEHGAGAILDTVLDSQDTVYLTCAGPFAKVFATLHQNVLDVGSGFDPLVRGNTRAFQPDPEEVKQLFNFI